MLIIPAIDLKDGQCVRLRQGRMEDSTVFSDDPVAMAGVWVEAEKTPTTASSSFMATPERPLPPRCWVR